MQPLLYESHMHTPLCKHAQGEPEDVLTHWLQGVAPTPDNAA